MRLLFPEAAEDVDPADVYADLPVANGRPSVRLNMISSIDGATTLNGVSGGLGSAGDKRVFAALRSLADVVLVAAGTVRAEHYGPSATPVAIVTRSAHLDWQSPFFTEPKARPIVLTGEDAHPDNLVHARQVADVLIVGASGVDIPRALAELGRRGYGHVLAEGGPSLNGQLVAANALDELCLTFSPNLAAGDGKRIIEAAAFPTPYELSLRSALEEEGFLFLRYRSVATSPPSSPST
ncbi:MAG: dihydrofolate reductase family protein [Acidimicrobiia bacterium]|nr:dihydrofolate reductase family protein [Acidimicrobiia bacterium]